MGRKTLGFDPIFPIATTCRRVQQGAMGTMIKAADRRHA
jgi:hypothetical protein